MSKIKIQIASYLMKAVRAIIIANIVYINAMVSLIDNGLKAGGLDSKLGSNTTEDKL